MAEETISSPPLGSVAIKARTLVLKQIKADHKAFKAAWQRFDKLNLATQRDEADELVRGMIVDLRFHSQFEQAHLYPAINAANDNRHRTELAESEHHAIDALLSETPLLVPLFSPRTAALFAAELARIQAVSPLFIAAMSGEVALEVAELGAQIKVANRPDAAAMADSIAVLLAKVRRA